MKTYLLGTTTLLALAASPAIAGKPVPIGEGVTLAPIMDGRLRLETVDQDNALRDATAATARMRAGIEIGSSVGLSALVETEGTLAFSERYNSTTNLKTSYSIVPDPENVELNRAQVQFKSKAFTLTGGRQRINLDDQRFVGSVAWRQNEQTFDAVRGEAKIGPVALDATYAWSQRTIFGIGAAARTAFDGNYMFLGAGVPLGPIKVKGFAYLIDYDADEPVALNSTQTYGVRATGSFKLGPKLMLNLAASYASQSDYKANPVDYTVDYVAADVGLAAGNYGVNGGLELLGSERNRAFQTPLATGHKFNGWADLFLTTPGQGLRDYYVGATAKFPGVKALPGLNALVTWHWFESDVGSQKFGKEWDAQIGFKLLKKLNILAKYADFDRVGTAKFTGDVSTRKFWLQLEYSL